MTEYSNIAYKVEGAVATIALDRPEAMNALSPGLVEELHAALDASNRDPQVRSIVVTGSGKAFSAGYDISSEHDMDETRAGALRDWWTRSMDNPDKMLHMMNLDKPVIAAVNGWCLGGGLWYALAADITIASDKATFGQPEIRMVSNSSFLFTMMAGWKNAHRYTLTGDHFDAQEALRIGIVNEVVPHDELATKANALAERLALVPPDSVRINKKISTMGLEALGLRNALNVNAALSVIVHASGDARDVDHLRDAWHSGGLRAMLSERDGPFLPEPGGPKSRPRD